MPQSSLAGLQKSLRRFILEKNKTTTKQHELREKLLA
jgi:hypothetical protein